jgi:hypothetical protein
LAPEKISELDHKIRVTAGIIRHLIINMEEDLARQAKDAAAQQALRRRPPKPKAKTEGQNTSHKDEIAPENKKSEKTSTPIEIDLDQQIEKALEEDLTK